MRSRRPLPVAVAAVVLGLLSLQNLVGPLSPGSEGTPAGVICSAVALGLAGLVAAAGLWLLKRWGIWLAVVVCVLNLLSAAPGIPFAPTAARRVAALVTVLVSALIIALVVLPTSRRAFVAT